MNQVATIAPERVSLIADMARRYSMEPHAFAATLRATVVPPKATNEEFAAFLMVAREYSLNPITKEIYAFPKQGGGIQPIVSVDGWANLINSHPQCDGIEFDDHLNDKGDLTAITCRIYRKDRSRPTTATEYMAECKRDTSTWKQWPRRMLRHKALIQAARYAFGFAGIVDPDEAERFTTARDVTPPPAPPQTPTVEHKPAAMIPPPAPKVQPETEAVREMVETSPQRPLEDDDIPPVLDRRPKAAELAPAFDPSGDPDKFLDDAMAQIAACQSIDALVDLWENQLAPYQGSVFPPDWEKLEEAHRRAEGRLAP